METWPEFVKEVEDRQSCLSVQAGHLTGWETVIFEVEDDQGFGSDVSSTAAIAP
jgi:hypothetical protein